MPAETICESESEDFTDIGPAIAPIIRDHDLLTLCELLEDDVRLSLRLRAIGVNARRGPRGCEVILFGRLAAGFMENDADALPAEIDVTFGDDGKIRSMTIAVVDPHALTAAIRGAEHEIAGRLFNHP